MAARRIWSRPLKQVLQAALVAAALFLLGRYVYFRWRDVSDVEFTFLAGPLLVSLLLLAVFYYGYSQSWQRMLSWITDEAFAVDRLNLHRVFFFSFVSRYLPAGNVLQLSGRVELLKREGGRRMFGIQSLYYEQLYFIGAAGLWAWLVLIARPVPWVPAWLTGLSLPGVGIGLLLCLLMLTAPDAVLRVGGKVLPSFSARLSGIVIPPLSLIRRVELLARFLIVNVAQGGAAYFVLWSIYPKILSIPGLFLVTAAAYPLSRVAGQLAVLVPGGIGVREGVFAVLLGPFLPVQAIILSAAIIRLVSVLMELAIVAILYALGRLRPMAGDPDQNAV